MSWRPYGLMIGLVIAAAIATAAMGSEGGGVRSWLVRPSAAEARLAAVSDVAPADEFTHTGWLHHLAERCVGPFALRDGRMTFSSAALAESQGERIAHGHC